VPDVGPPETWSGSTGGRRRGTETVVPWNRAIGTFVGIFLTGTAGMLALVSVSVSAADPWSEYLANATGLAVISCALLLVASTRADGVGDQLKVVNFFTTVTVPGARVRGAEAESGLAIVLDDERRVDCVAYGSSILKDLFPRLRPVRHVGRVEQWASRHGGGPFAGPPSDRDVRTSIRTFVWCGFPLLWLASMSYMAVVRTVADPLRALFQVPM
jgi:hypothetical protein